MKPVRILDHARFEMSRRGISEAEIRATIAKPSQIVPGKKGRQIYQSLLPPHASHLLRVVVKDEAVAYDVVTAYKTSKVDKYWRQP